MGSASFQVVATLGQPIVGAALSGSSEANTGIWNAAQAAVPAAPTIGTATAGDAQASVAFTPGADGGAAVDQYRATCGAASATGAASPVVVTGLANGTPVTCTVAAHNSVGWSAESVASNVVTPLAPAAVPGAPVIGAVTPGNASAGIAFTPGTAGSAPTDNYRATCSGGFLGYGTASPITVSGLSNGTSYTCTVAAHNTIGWSAESAASGPVTPTAVALISRTYVASYGSDANTVHSCDSAHPCRSFAAAFSRTASGGDIIVADGSGYGTLVIDRSVSIIANPGRFAGIGVFSGGTGISIATAGVNVTLRGLTFNGYAGGGAYGINMSDGARLSIENCVIAGFGSAGVYVNTPASVRVIDSVFRDNSRGLQLDGGASASIAGSKFHGNSGNAILVGGTAAGTLSTAAISHSVVMGSGADWGISAQSLNATAGARAHVIRSSVSNSAVGVSATSAAGGPASVVVSRSKVSGNATGLSQSGAGAVLRSLGNNAITGNTTDTAGTITAVPPM